MLEPLGDAERQAASLLNLELDEHLRLTELAFNLIAETLVSFPDRPIADISKSFKVTVPLLNRVANDIRGASLLALCGYALQAASLVASMYESAFTIAYIGADDALAQHWIDHDDPTRPFTAVCKMTQAVFNRLPVPDPEQTAKDHYRTYTQLCMAKHTNPLLARQHAYHIVDDTLFSRNGPDTSDPAIRAAWFSLEHSLALVFLALGSFISAHVPSERRPPLIRKLHELGQGRKTLSGKAAARWGTTDPFPGKW